MSPWHISTAPVPASLDDPDAWALHGSAAVSLASDLDLWGIDDLAYTARYMLARMNEREYAERIRLVATAEHPGTSPLPPEAVLGTAYLIMPTQSNEHLTYLELVVHPAHRGRGIGSALLAEVERLTADRGRTTIIVASEHGGEPPAGTPGALEPPTGSGRIAGDDRAARFAQRHGYGLEQAERYSVLQLPVPTDHVSALLSDAAAHAGDEYRLVRWTDRTPDEWLDSFALLNTRMSTDTPQGELDMEEDPWDVARVRSAEGDIAAAGHGYLAVAAEHVPTSTLAAFTRVEYPHDQPEVVYQEDTLVLKEHRGRRLGMLVKAAMVQQLTELRPDARRLHTWNAEENEHMLAINVALGFRPTGVEGVWQKRLATAKERGAGD